MPSEDPKAVLRRWYDEMWSQKNGDLILELVGPAYVRHEMGGTRSVTPQEYCEQTKGFMQQVEISDMRYSLVAEGDKVCAIGTWKVNGKQWDWVQVFRVSGGRLVETWLSGIGMESNWTADVYQHLSPVIEPV